MKPRSTNSLLIGFVLICSTSLVVLNAQAGGRHSDGVRRLDGKMVTILVTPHPRNKKQVAAAEKLKAEDFAIKENGSPQKVTAVKPASQVPTVVEVLIQDNLAADISNELEGIKKFILNLPEGSHVLTGYITTGSLDVTQDFTTDRSRAAESLRVLNRQVTYDPYIELIEGLKKFDSQPEGRRMVVLISNGLDLSQDFDNANPERSIDLKRAIREAQERGVAVFSIYASTSTYAPGFQPSTLAGADANFGPASLIKLSGDTGGEAFIGTNILVSFSPYWRKIQDLMSRQWLVTYESTNTREGFRRIEVQTGAGMHLGHPAGYWVK